MTTARWTIDCWYQGCGWSRRGFDPVGLAAELHAHADARHDEVESTDGPWRRTTTWETTSSEVVDAWRAFPATAGRVDEHVTWVRGPIEQVTYE